MAINKPLLAHFVTSICMAGCGTCHQATVVQPTAMETVPFVESREGQAFITLKILSEIQLDLASCRENKSIVGPICAYIRVPDGHSLRFLSADFMLASESDARSSKVLPVSDIHYDIVCKYEGPNIQCDSPEEPVSDDKKLKREISHRYRWNNVETIIYTYSFALTTEFAGVRKQSRMHGLQSFHSSDYMREYSIKVVASSLLGAPSHILHMPSIKIGSKVIRLPKIRLATINREICGVRQLM